MGKHLDQAGGEGAPPALDEILEPPLAVREFDIALAGHLSRTDRRRFWAALRAAQLIVFRA